MMAAADVRENETQNEMQDAGCKDAEIIIMFMAVHTHTLPWTIDTNETTGSVGGTL